MSEIDSAVREIGATRKYKGYAELVEAIRLVFEIQDHHVRVTKDIYPVLARKHQCEMTNIEHNIRNLLEACWRTNKDDFERIAGCKLLYRPSNSEFLDMIVTYIMKQRESGS